MTKHPDSPIRRHYEFIEHTADIAVKAYGRSVEDAFATAAVALFDVITDGGRIKSERPLEFEVESVDTEGLLVGFLSHLLVLHEADGYVLTDFNVQFAGPTTLKVTCGAVAYDADKHGRGHHVKGVSYHMMEIFRGGHGENSFVQVLFDV